MRFLAIVLILGFVASPVVAADRAYPYEVSRKLLRGLNNVFTSPGEIPKNYRKEGYRSFLDGNNLAVNGLASTSGALLGVGYMVARFFVGVYEIVTFPIPSKPLMEPEALYCHDDTPRCGTFAGYDF